MRNLILIFLVLSLLSCEEKQVETIKKTRPIKYSKVELTSGVESHTFSAVAKAKNETKLSFKVAGTLSSVKVQLGDLVKKGQLIATIDPVDYNLQTNQAISQKEGSVANAEAAKAQLINSKATYERVAKLYENNSISLSEYQQAKASLDAAKAQFDAANSQINTSDQQIQAAGNQVNYTRLISPMNGIITAVEVEDNEVVSSGMVIAKISSKGQPEVEVGVPEIFINKINKGQNVKITLPSISGHEYDGIVDRVSYASGNSPTYPVIVELDKSIKSVRPGMAANVKFQFEPDAENQPSKLLIPVEAVGKDDKGNFVYALRQKADNVFTVEKKIITIGDLLPKGFAVKSGLEDGELVATAGLKSLINGQEVKLLND